MTMSKISTINGKYKFATKKQWDKALPLFFCHSFIIPFILVLIVKISYNDRT